jgi:hypothetical protein
MIMSSSWSGVLASQGEQAPLTGVYQSFQGRVHLNNDILARVQNANIRFGNSVNRFLECGRRSPTIYEGSLVVTGRIRQALASYDTLRLLLGFEAGVLDNSGNPINPHLNDGGYDLGEAVKNAFAPAFKGSGGVAQAGGDITHFTKNTYPKPVDVSLQINFELASGTTPTWMTAKNCILNGGNISLRARGILMQDIDFRGSYVVWAYQDDKP